MLKDKNVTMAGFIMLALFNYFDFLSTCTTTQCVGVYTTGTGTVGGLQTQYLNCIKRRESKAQVSEWAIVEGMQCEERATFTEKDKFVTPGRRCKFTVKRGVLSKTGYLSCYSPNRSERFADFFRALLVLLKLNGSSKSPGALPSPPPTALALALLPSPRSPSS